MYDHLVVSQVLCFPYLVHDFICKILAHIYVDEWVHLGLCLCLESSVTLQGGKKPAADG